jgi:hypothetical protein
MRVCGGCKGTQPAPALNTTHEWPAQPLRSLPNNHARPTSGPPTHHDDGGGHDVKALRLALHSEFKGGCLGVCTHKRGEVGREAAGHRRHAQRVLQQQARQRHKCRKLAEGDLRFKKGRESK